jgi:hypothetical protein
MLQARVLVLLDLSVSLLLHSINSTFAALTNWVDASSPATTRAARLTGQPSAARQPDLTNGRKFSWGGACSAVATTFADGVVTIGVHLAKQAAQVLFGRGRGQWHVRSGRVLGGDQFAAAYLCTFSGTVSKLKAHTGQFPWCAHTVLWEERSTSSIALALNDETSRGPRALLAVFTYVEVHCASDSDVAIADSDHGEHIVVAQLGSTNACAAFSRRSIAG